MTNIPYKAVENYEPKRVLDLILARRGARGLMNLDRMLLHSPPVAEGWNALLGCMRGALELDPKLRELAICAVAVLNGADYELHHHLPIWKQTGATDEQVAALQQIDRAVDAMCFDSAERAVVSMSLAMTHGLKVPPETLNAVDACLPSVRQVFELIAVIATYNMVSRVLVATGVEIEHA
jgi:alkylhydroperoxidase family enzyme